MCLLIAKPAGVKIDEQSLFNGFKNNKDGCGFVYAENGELKLVKGCYSWEYFIEEYRKVETLPMLIHFRVATSGKINDANCHPFLMLDGKVAMAHNGVFDIEIQDKEYSDTYHYAYTVIEPLLKYGVPFDDSSLFFLLEAAIGFNKLAMIDGTGRIVICNDDKGNYDEQNIWYSNYSYRVHVSKKDKKKAKGGMIHINTPIIHGSRAGVAPSTDLVERNKTTQKLIPFQNPPPMVVIEPHFETAATGALYWKNSGLATYSQPDELEIGLAMLHFRYDRPTAIKFLKTNGVIGEPIAPPNQP